MVFDALLNFFAKERFNAVDYIGGSAPRTLDYFFDSFALFLAFARMLWLLLDGDSSLHKELTPGYHQR